MKRFLLLLLFFPIFYSLAQTKVGNFHFNDIDTFGDKELMLNGAGKRDNLYVLGLYLDFEVDGVQDGIMVADKDETMAFTLKSSSHISNKKLTEIVRNGLERATDGNSYQYEDEIRNLIAILPKEIEKYQIFRIVYTKGDKISLYKNMNLLGSVKSGIEFKQALFKIWLGENPVDEKLKEDLLGTAETNPVLGQWKTYDKKTGVAISIIQLYVIKDRVHGSINRMLRQSERDAVCYECQGDDKNQKVEGLVILKRLREDGPNKYVDGKFTNITDGKVVDCQIWLDKKDENILNVKYKGGGGVHKWKRIKDTKDTKRIDLRTVKSF